MNNIQLRELFITFFKKKKHVILPPISLVSIDDPTTLFTGFGMQQLVPYLLGQPHPLGKRLVNIQRCFRAQDIEEVGDNRHDTFFEMMGNWSLGDYFKREQLSWCFEFFIEVLKIDPKRLYVSVFKGDDKVVQDKESVRIWKDVYKKYGIKGEINKRIFLYGREKNWWARGDAVGEPCGPDSEVFYDTGIRHSKDFGKTCHPNCECGKFLEICNNVFMQYQKTKQGFTKLAKRSVDVGYGLERILVAVQNKNDIFQTDVFYPLILKIEEISGEKFGRSNLQNRSFRIISDHLKAATFLLADSVIPSNVEQGYVLRRLVRRAVRFANQLGLSQGFSKEIAKTTVEVFSSIYPHLKENETIIYQHLIAEEKKFARTLHKGQRQFEKFIESGKISGEDAFFLYESFGFPIELTQEFAREKGIKVDLKEFERAKRRHKRVSRKGSKAKFKGGLADQSEATIKLHTATHLLHQALGEILGSSVKQMGSNITSERLRFDFYFTEPLNNEQLQKIEQLVNKKIKKNLPVRWQIMDFKEAIKQKVLAYFGQKYGEKVKVYSIGDFSKEVCGGPHVDFTGKLGRFKIIKETSLSSNTRRIYAVLINTNKTDD